VDFTAMLMVMVFTLVYILSARVEHKANLLIGMLGALLYLGLKTKETTIVSGLLLVGLAFDEDSHLSIRAFVRRSPYLIIGLISGVVIFSILSWIFLRDPFWGLRISEWQGFLHSSAPFYRGQRPLVLGNWYTSYLLRGLLTPFLLYVISAARVTRRPIWKVIWLLPLTLIVFLTLTVLDAWGFIARFMLPVVPVICFLAPQFLEFDQVVTWREFLRGYAILLLGTLIILALRLQIGSWLADSAVSPAFFIVVAFFPVVLSVTLAIIFMSPRLSHRVSIVLALLIVALTIVPITANVKSALIVRPNKVRSDSLFYPFSSFKSTIKFTPDMKMYISQHLWRINQGPMTADPGMAKNIDEVRFLFDMYFGVPAARDNFALAADVPMKDILHTKYNYVLITEQEWLQFSSNPENLRRAEDLYEAFYDPYGLVVLLRERESPLPSSYSECDQKPAWEQVPSMSAPGFSAANSCCWRLLVCGPSLRSLPSTVCQQNVARARFLNLDVQGVR